MNKRNDIVAAHYRLNFDRLVKRTQHRVPNNSSALAEEVVQEAYTRALKYYRTFSPQRSSFNTWFSTLLRNATKDCRTKESGSGVSRELEENDQDVAHDEPYVTRTTIIQEIEKFPTKNDDVLRWFYLYNFSTREIGEISGHICNNIRQIIFKFKRRLEELYGNNKGIV